MSTFSLQIPAWPNSAPIPPRHAFGKLGSPMELSDNISPEVSWSEAPQETRSFALIVSDPDVPSAGDDVNIEGREVPADLPRVPFFHWVLVDLPVNVTAIAQGAAASGITAGGKPVGESLGGIAGANDYTGWFASDPAMAGTYGGYDGPCPPWNDSIMHHYHFEVFALDVDTLDIAPSDLTGPTALAAMEGHILARAAHMGTYSLNAAVQV